MIDQIEGTPEDEGLAELLTVREKLAIITAALVSYPEGRPPEEDLERIRGWAEAARRDATLLEGILEGNVDVLVEDGELKFFAPERRRSPQNLALSRQLLRDILAGRQPEDLEAEI